MTPSYPKRDNFFAVRFLRLTVKCLVANKVGPDGLVFLHAIVSWEDELRYSGPVQIPQSILQAQTGIKSHRAFLAVRKRLIDAGWLAYLPGTRTQAPQYWVTIPEAYERLLNSPSGAVTPGVPGGPNGADEVPEAHFVAADPVPDEVPQAHLVSDEVRDQVRDQVPKRNTNAHTYNPSPTPKECSAAQNTSGIPDGEEGKQSDRPKARKFRFTEWDRVFACRMAGELKLTYAIKTPSFDAWANDVRLLRERDGRSPAEIEAMWDWVKRDEFWSQNILCPGTLRAKWDRLNAKRCRARPPTGKDIFAGNREIAERIAKANGNAPSAAESAHGSTGGGDRPRLHG